MVSSRRPPPAPCPLVETYRFPNRFATSMKAARGALSVRAWHRRCGNEIDQEVPPMRSVAFALLFVFIAVTSLAAVPRLIMSSDDGGDAVVLSAATVRVTIRGHLARTEYELTFRNRLARVVGGDFVFP